MSEENATSNDENKRPGFLTVLCILTFVGSGLGVLGGILGLIGSSALASLVPAGGTVIQTAGGLVAAGLCLFGAIQMWGLKKQGFMLYLIGVIISIAISLYAVLTFPTDGVFGAELVVSAMWTSFAIGLGINVLFVILYNINKKHLIN
tara:strand:+ start:116 stop:559 length:444 start_codon:yes stop_codon:yes gene_type:complete